MHDAFSNREIAIGIWSAVIFLWAISKSGIRSSLFNVLRAFFQPQILAILTLMSIYIVLMVFTLHRAHLWEFRQLKDTILWALFVAAASMFGLDKIARSSAYFVDTMKDSLRLIVFIEFVVSMFVFSLAAELVIVPIVTMLGLLHLLAERDKKLIQVAKLLNWIIVAGGAFVVLHAAYSIAADLAGFANFRTFADLSITPVLTLCFFPFLFFSARFSRQQLVAGKLRQTIKDDRLRRYAYVKSLLRFRFRVSSLDRWAMSLFTRSIADRSDIDLSISRICQMESTERDPPFVPYVDGWSPHTAREFLTNEGLKPGFYNTVDDIEWYASSPPISTSKDSLSTILYSLEGNARAATRLFLELSAYETQAPPADMATFLAACNALYEAAMEHGPPLEVEQVKNKWVIENREIRIQKEEWIHRPGFDLKFSICVISPT